MPSCHGFYQAGIASGKAAAGCVDAGIFVGAAVIRLLCSRNPLCANRQKFGRASAVMPLYRIRRFVTCIMAGVNISGLMVPSAEGCRLAYAMIVSTVFCLACIDWVTLVLRANSPDKGISSFIFFSCEGKRSDKLEKRPKASDRRSIGFIDSSKINGMAPYI